MDVEGIMLSFLFLKNFRPIEKNVVVEYQYTLYVGSSVLPYLSVSCVCVCVCVCVLQSFCCCYTVWG